MTHALRQTFAVFLSLTALAACSTTTTVTDAGDSGPDASMDAGDAGLDAGVDAGNQGLACTADSQCSSGICGIAGTGHCCLATCGGTGDGGAGDAGGSAACGAVDCDSTGQCLYPGRQVNCGGAVCSASEVSVSACNGAGSCEVTRQTPCPDNLACASDGTRCIQACETLADCRSGFYCSARQCIPQQATGYCSGDEVCLSGSCIGNSCCSQSCPGTDAVCGATACAPTTGACVYPGTLVPCGSAGARSCSGAELHSTYCDGSGNCGSTAIAQACANLLACDSSAATCFANCADAGDSACAAGAVCSGGSCCQALLDGGVMYVDQDLGSDAACCGATNEPCGSLTHALGLISSSGAEGVVVNLRAKTNLWHAAETYPIRLGRGVTVNAPGVEFADVAGTVFEAAPVAGEPAAAVTLQGNATSPLLISPDGLDQIGIQVGADGGALASLNLNYAQVHARLEALDVEPNAQATIGSGVVLSGSQGVAMLCRGTPSEPAGILALKYNAFSSKAPANGGQGGADVEGNCTLNLTNFNLEGFGAASNLFGIRAIGDATLSLTTGTVGGFYEDGVLLLPDDAGAVPTADFTGVELYQNGCAGLYQKAGNVTMTASSFWMSYFSVILDGTGTLDLSGSGDAGNQLWNSGGVCGGGVTPHCPADTPVVAQNPNSGGAGVLNASTNSTINLDGALLGDFNDPPTTYICQDFTLQDCTCGAGCSGAAPGGESAVALKSNPKPFSSVGTTGINECPGACIGGGPPFAPPWCFQPL